jgi:hypothetical protein
MVDRKAGAGAGILAPDGFLLLPTGGNPDTGAPVSLTIYVELPPVGAADTVVRLGDMLPLQYRAMTEYVGRMYGVTPFEVARMPDKFNLATLRMNMKVELLKQGSDGSDSGSGVVPHYAFTLVHTRGRTDAETTLLQDVVPDGGDLAAVSAIIRPSIMDVMTTAADELRELGKGPIKPDVVLNKLPGALLRLGGWTSPLYPTTQSMFVDAPGPGGVLRRAAVHCHAIVSAWNPIDTVEVFRETPLAEGQRCLGGHGNLWPLLKVSRFEPGAGSRELEYTFTLTDAGTTRIGALPDDKPMLQPFCMRTASRNLFEARWRMFVRGLERSIPGIFAGKKMELRIVGAGPEETAIVETPRMNFVCASLFATSCILRDTQFGLRVNDGCSHLIVRHVVPSVYPSTQESAKRQGDAATTVASEVSAGSGTDSMFAEVYGDTLSGWSTTSASVGRGPGAVSAPTGGGRTPLPRRARVTIQMTVAPLTMGLVTGCPQGCVPCVLGTPK